MTQRFIRQFRDMAFIAYCRVGSLHIDDSSHEFLRACAGGCYLSEMCDISAASYCRLLYFYRTASFLTVPFTRRGDPSSWFFEEQSCGKGTDVAPHEKANLNSLLDREADVVLQSLDRVQFRAPTLLFRLSGAMEVLDDGSIHLAEDGKLPVIQLGLDSRPDWRSYSIAVFHRYYGFGTTLEPCAARCMSRYPSSDCLLQEGG